MVLLVALVTSVGAVAVTAQTPSAAPAPTATPPPKPTCTYMIASRQSIMPNDYAQYLVGYVWSGNQPVIGVTVSIYAPGRGGQLGTATTDSLGRFEFGIQDPTGGQVTVYYYAYFLGNPVYPGYSDSMSNYVYVKYENTKTKPYETAFYAYAPVQVTQHGHADQIMARLVQGDPWLGGKSLSGQQVTLWRLSGSTWVKVKTTSTGYNGWVKYAYTATSAQTRYYHWSFAGNSPYAGSDSNGVLLKWT